MEFLTSISTMELSFHEWVPILFVSCTLVTRYTVLPEASNYSGGLQEAVISTKMQQCVRKGEIGRTLQASKHGHKQLFLFVSRRANLIQMHGNE